MTEEAPTRPLKYRADIDGLRAVAVLAVVGFHAFPQGIPGGFVGVDIFFVISGFLISTIIFEQLEANRFSFTLFYGRRIRRIFPALLVVLAVVLAAGWFALLPYEYEQLGKHVAAGGGFVSNIVLWSESGYFDHDAASKPLLHLWSLGIEEQFYLAWPAILWVCHRRNVVLPAMAAIAVLSFGLNVINVQRDAIATFYLPQTRFWELAMGSILAYFSVCRRDLLSRVQAANAGTQSLVGACLIAIALATITRERAFPGWWALLPTLGTAMILAADHAWLNRVVLSNRLLVNIGLISFPLYLFHWPLLVFAQMSEADRLARSTRIAAVLVAFVLSWLTYRFVEKPVRFGSARHRAPAILAGGMLAVSVAGIAVSWHDGVEGRSALLDVSITQSVNEQFKEWQYTSNRRCLERYPSAEAAKFSTWFCMLSADREPTVLILGSSYANQLYPGFIQNERLRSHTFLNIGLCDPASADEAANADVIDERPCVGRKLLLQQRFYESVIAGQKTIRFAVLDGLNRDPDTAYISRLRRRIDFLESHGIRVIVFTPHLRLGHHPKACFSTPLNRTPANCSFDLAARKAIDEKFEPLVREISKSNPMVRFFDQNDLFCDGQKCSMVSAGMPLARDYGHVSEFGSLKIQGIFSRWAEKNIPEILGVQAPSSGAPTVQPQHRN